MRLVTLTVIALLTMGNGPLHWPVRDAIIQISAPQLTPHVSILGDSITEAWTVSELCGQPVLNMGYGGITTAGLGQKIATLAPLAGTKAFLMVGMNDAYGPNEQLAHDGAVWWYHWQQSGVVVQNTYQTWRVWHAHIVQVLQQHQVQVVLVTIPPVAPTALVSQNAIKQLNDGIKFLGMMWGIPTVDVHAAGGSTVDGIHPTPQSYTTMAQVLSGGC